MTATDSLTLVLGLAGLVGALGRALLTVDQPFRSRQTVVDALAGGLVGVLWPLYPLLDFPASATTLQKALIVGAIAYLAGDVITNALARVTGMLRNLSGPTASPPVPPVAKNLVVALGLGSLTLATGCTGPGWTAGLSPEQLHEWARVKDAAVTCVRGVYAGATVTSISISADKGLSAAVAIDENCKVQLMSESAGAGKKPTPPSQ